jgi:DNA helicase-2/ATP-dependent DNA helicase PcrA
MVSLSHLNHQQHQAVCHTQGPLLILAGAGSGKTRVIVHRIAYLLAQGVDPHCILAISFTNRAVHEMAERVASMIKDRQAVSKLTLSTFHSLGAKILREEIYHLDYPTKFTIYDPSDQLSLLRGIMREHRIDEDIHSPRDLLAGISMAKNLFLDPQDLHHITHRECYSNIILLKQIYTAYENGLHTCGAVDFDDLIRLPVKIFKQFPDVQRAWSDRYSQIMIDEYQDTNRAQLLMVEALAEVHKNICVVGDDDQSIYGWRGSDIKNILNFEKQFPKTTVIMLTQNYRCSGNILAAANTVIAQNTQRYCKELWTEANHGPRIGLAILKDEEAEARYVTDHLRQIKYEDQRPWRDFAVMYRTNAQSRSFEDIMRQERIPYILIGGQDFFERKEIKDVLSYLKLIHLSSDEIALRRVINYPTRSIGDTSIKHLFNAVRCGQYKTLYEACVNANHITTLSTHARKSILEFVALIERYRNKATTHLPSVLTRDLIEEIRLFQSLYREYKTTDEAKNRIDNLSSLINAIEQYERHKVLPSLDDYIERVSLNQRADDDDKNSDKDAVTLITLHGAKGLEYPVVYLVGFEEGLLPFYRQGEKPDLEEERRLCYVGITRAKQRLYLTHTQERRRFGRTLQTEPSRFLEDIPQDLIASLQLEQNSSSEEELDRKVQSLFSNIQSILR